MQRRPRILVALFSLAALAPAIVSAQSASYILSQNGKPVGTASCRFTPAATGIESTSIVRVNMQGLNYSLSKTEQLSAAHQLLLAQLSASVNSSAVTVNAAPNAGQTVIDTSSNGHTDTARLPSHPRDVFLPDFDPGALQTLLYLAVASNNRGLWAIIPKQSNSIQPIQLATYADETGTLDGQPIVVHHLVATIGNGVTDIFSSPENQLLQAELPQKGFSLARQGFVLTPPKNPGAPPAQ